VASLPESHKSWPMDITSLLLAAAYTILLVGIFPITFFFEPRRLLTNAKCWIISKVWSWNGPVGEL
jgi:hypothetical protein